MHPANRCDQTPGWRGRLLVCKNGSGPICLCLSSLLQKYLENYLNRLLTMSFYRNYHAMVRPRGLGPCAVPGGTVSSDPHVAEALGLLKGEVSPLSHCLPLQTEFLEVSRLSFIPDLGSKGL